MSNANANVIKLLLSLALAFLILAISSVSQAAYPGNGLVELIEMPSSSDQSPNIPDEGAIKALTEVFESSKTILADGDLKLGSRWNCRELFTEASGRTNYRFRAFSFQLYDSGILEDTLNISPKLYTHTRLGLVGRSALLADKFTEIRIDPQGNLRLAEKRGEKLTSLIVCLAKNMHAAQ